jgi:hypothetical protein
MGTRVAIPGHAYTHFGTREIDDKFPQQYNQTGGIKTYTLTWSYDDLPTESLDDSIVQSLPANSRINSSTLRVTEAFAGGTSYNIGLYETDGTVIDADGIDAAVALTAIDAVGETVVNDGVLVGNTAGIGSAAGQVRIAATGIFTAGRAVLEIEYTSLNDRANSN